MSTLLLLLLLRYQKARPVHRRAPLPANDCEVRVVRFVNSSNHAHRLGHSPALDPKPSKAPCATNHVQAAAAAAILSPRRVYSSYQRYHHPHCSSAQDTSSPDPRPHPLPHAAATPNPQPRPNARPRSRRLDCARALLPGSTPRHGQSARRRLVFLNNNNNHHHLHHHDRHHHHRPFHLCSIPAVVLDHFEPRRRSLLPKGRRLRWLQALLQSP